MTASRPLYRRRRRRSRGPLVAAVAVVALLVVAMVAATSQSSSPGLLRGAVDAPAPPSSALSDAVSAVADAEADPDAGGRDSTAGTPRDEPPEVPVAAYAVLDGKTQQVLAGRRADERRPVASIVKLMTARVVLQAGELDREVTVPPLQIAEDESNVGLAAGETLTRNALLRALLVPSAGDAAAALAIDVAGSEAAFVDRMNAEADGLGLARTRYANAAGLDAQGAASTARDSVRLAWSLMQDGRVRAIVREDAVQLHGESYAATNTLLDSYAGADGVKTGHTDEAGWCLVASAYRDGRRMYVAVLGARSEGDRDAAASLLLDWAFAQVAG